MGGVCVDNDCDDGDDNDSTSDDDSDNDMIIMAGNGKYTMMIKQLMARMTGDVL